VAWRNGGKLFTVNQAESDRIASYSLPHLKPTGGIAFGARDFETVADQLGIPMLL
jgi:hypothetical protein